MENPVIACDQAQNRVVLYDLSDCDGDPDACEKWSYAPPYPSAKNLSGVKYRRNTVYGDVMLIVASGGYAGIVSYPEGKEIWHTDYCGNNPHSIEILPCGDVVTASSTGNELYFYPLSAGLCPDVPHTVYAFDGAHGLLWDPDGEVLWAVGDTELRAYRTDQNGLTQIPGKGGQIPCPYGHDLSCDRTDNGFLWVAGDPAVVRFDKKNNRFITDYDGHDVLSDTYIKGFGNNDRGNFVSCRSTGGAGMPWANLQIAGWCTPLIRLVRPTTNGYEAFMYRSSTCAYYKVICFDGRY